MSSDYRYACCAHCRAESLSINDLSHIDGHDEPCPHGCNDGEGAA